MTIKQKNELIAAVTALLDKMIPVDEMEPTPITMSKADKPEMLVKQNKVKYIRCGEGVRGKILVSRGSLPKYLGAVSAEKNGRKPEPNASASSHHGGAGGTACRKDFCCSAKE